MTPRTIVVIEPPLGGVMSAQSQAAGGPRPSADDVRAHLARLLASGAFPASARRRKLLAYIVDETLAGRSDRLKAYSLAVSILGRKAGFDPHSDPIVRIEFARLRRGLERYYLTDGRDDPIRITIPKGHYIPAFEARHRDAEPERVVAAPTAWQLKWRHRLGGRGTVAGTSAARRKCRLLRWDTGLTIRPCRRHVARLSLE